eukprot:Tbor_TRINITY_DN5785_c1_g1::TRINITY_DN5785_c1_g1_i1::g.20991::m.20991
MFSGSTPSLESKVTHNTSVYDQECTNAHMIIATDGSCKDVQMKNGIQRQCTSAHAIWFNRQKKTAENKKEEPTPEPYHTYSSNAGPLACSYRSEQLAILGALSKIVNMVSDASQDTLTSLKLVVLTDSLSVLQSLQQGPLRQKTNVITRYGNA